MADNKSETQKFAPLKDMENPDQLKQSISYQVGELKELSKVVDPATLIARHERVEFTPAEGKQVLRKIDRWLLPMLMWVYMIQFADKTSLNYASVMGLRTDVHLDSKSQQYSW